MAESNHLSDLTNTTFEHLVNALAMNVLGPGHTSFGPGADAGRDGYFEGEANYPSEADRWSGVWYIQSKYHAPHLSKDSQKWLLAQIVAELKEFSDPSKRRRWPDNWIVCTNIDPSGVAETGAFDQARQLVADARPTLQDRFHIWGGKKILDLLNEFPRVRDAYGHFLTPGHVLSEMRAWFADERASVDDIIRALVVQEFGEQQHTKLEQAGSDADARPGVHKLFIDLPFAEQCGPFADLALSSLHKCSNGVKKQLEGEPQTKAWQTWRCHPTRARVWFLFGGPGQGKSTLGQFFSQIQRAAFILSPDGAPSVSDALKTLAIEISEVAVSGEYWPRVPRIPIIVELREYSHWLSRQPAHAPCGVMTYLCQKLSQTIEKEVKVGTLERAFQKGLWFVAFDGLDEVPADNKDAASKHVKHFIEEVAVRTNCDLLCLCTSRPQGYGGQLDSLDCARLQLQHLDPTRAIKCAEPVLSIGRSATDARNYLNILTNAIASPGGVRELMRTPLQCHIMAVVVRDGGKPPERRWQLFNNFYEVIKRREANKELTDRRIEKLLRQNDKLLRSIHNRMGFVLHSMGETSDGATTSMRRNEFEALARVTVKQMLDDDIEEMVATLCQATEHRLVLVNTPDDGQHLRFDVRQLQEFFAAEFLYESVSIEQLADRLRLIAGDAHWREVMHFLYSALVEAQRFPELTAAVRVLEELNDGDPNTAGRIFARRLGAGASIAGRLLTEGVLEQDKRVRQQFKTAFEPLLSRTSFSHVNLASINQPNSHAWLLGAMIQQLEEADTSECIGAGFWVATMIGDEHPLSKRAAALNRSKGIPFLDGVLSGIVDCHTEGAASGWLLRLAIERLVSASSDTLTIRCVNNALSITAGVDKTAFCIAAHALALSDEHRDLLWECAVAKQPKDGTSASNDVPIPSLEHVSHGSVVASYLKDDWTSGTGSAVESATFNLSNCVGFCRLLVAIAAFHNLRSRTSFLNVILELTSTKEPLLSCLPPHQRARFPALDRSVPLKKLRAVVEKQTDEEFAVSLKTHRLGVFVMSRWAVTFSVTGGHGIEDCSTLISERPAVAVILVFGHFGRSLAAESYDPALLDRFRVQALETPSVFVDHAEMLGAIFSTEDHLPVRDAIVKEAERFPARMPRLFSGSSLHPFFIRLPEERALLPPLLAGFIRHCRFESRSPSEQLDVDELLSRYAMKHDALLGIADDLATSLFQRGAAVVFATLQADAFVRTLTRFESILLECAVERNELIVDAILFAISIKGSHEDLVCTSFIGRLFDVLKHDYVGRRKIQNLLDIWREQSVAPVTTSNVMAKWIASSD